MLQRIEAYGKINEVLENAAALFVMEDYLIQPLIGKNSNIFRFPYFIFADNFEVYVKKDIPASKLKIATVGFINDRRNVDFILETLMAYKGEPIEYYLYGKPVGKVGEKIEQMAKECSFPENVKVYTKFDYLSDEEYIQISRDCDFILIAYDEKRNYQTPGAIYQFNNQNTILIVPKIESFVTLGNVYENLFLFYDNLSSDSLNKLLSVLAKKGKKYRDFKEKCAVARKKFVADNKQGVQVTHLEDIMKTLIKKRHP
jgi:glycosyltransferase involved in cell wall biosynthesis